MVLGEQQGWIGYPVDIVDGIAVLVWNTNDVAPDLQVSLACLLLDYRPGDHVKCRWADAHGIVSSVNDDLGTISFVERRSHHDVSIAILAMVVDNSFPFSATPSWTPWSHTRLHHHSTDSHKGLGSISVGPMTSSDPSVAVIS